jgi:hypothetical protein
MIPAGNIDWSAAAWRLELAVAAMERDGLVIDRDLADVALAQCRRYAGEGEPPGEFLPPNDPLLDLACRHGLSIDWILIGDPDDDDRSPRRPCGPVSAARRRGRRRWSRPWSCHYDCAPEMPGGGLFNSEGAWMMNWRSPTLLADRVAF